MFSDLQSPPYTRQTTTEPPPSPLPLLLLLSHFPLLNRLPFTVAEPSTIAAAITEPSVAVCHKSHLISAIFAYNYFLNTTKSPFSYNKLQHIHYQDFLFSPFTTYQAT